MAAILNERVKLRASVGRGSDKLLCDLAEIPKLCLQHQSNNILKLINYALSKLIELVNLAF